MHCIILHCVVLHFCKLMHVCMSVSGKSCFLVYFGPSPWSNLPLKIIYVAVYYFPERDRYRDGETDGRTEGETEGGTGSQKQRKKDRDRGKEIDGVRDRQI